MPLPNPGNKESKDKFIQRCVSDPKVNKEYPDNAQRYAVCQTQWKKKEKANIEKAVKDLF